jgi:sulfite oxidase
LISVIAPTPVAQSPGKGIGIRGYAVNGTSPVAYVDISTDEGKTWKKATETYREGEWSWMIWETEIPWEQFDGTEEGREVRVISRATSESGEKQAMKAVWNVRGVGYCAVGEAVFRL